MANKPNIPLAHVLIIIGVLIFAVVVLFWALGAEAREQDRNVWTVPPEYQSGGFIEDYNRKIKKLDAQGVTIQITKSCSSACTFFLAAERVCVAPRARLNFHGPSANWTAIVGVTGVPVGIATHGMSPENRAYWVQWMANLYDSRWPGMGNWFKANAAHKFGFQFTTLRGSTVHKAWGVPLCPNT